MQHWMGDRLPGECETDADIDHEDKSMCPDQGERGNSEYKGSAPEPDWHI